MKKQLIKQPNACRYALAGLSLACLPALAQDSDTLNTGSVLPVDQTARLPITVSLGGSEQFKSDIDKNNGVQGKFSIARFNVSVAAPVRLGDRFALNTTVRYELDNYDFTDLPAKVQSPWENINFLTIGETLNWRADEHWSYYIGGQVKMAAESGASLGQGTTGGGLIGFDYKFSDTLSLGAGFAGASQIEESAMFRPIITVKWKFADQWRLEVGATDISTAGYGAVVKYDLNQDWTFGLGAEGHKSRFRVDQNSGIGQESALTVYADATWHATSKLDVQGFFGVTAGGKLRADNSDGVKQFQSDYKPAPILGLKAAVRF